MDQPRKLLWTDVLFCVFYPALHIAAGVIGVGTVFAMGFGLRDAFCYPSYMAHLLTMMLIVLLFSLPLPVLAALWAGARMQSRFRWLVALSPVALLIFAWFVVLLSELASFHVTRDHCSAGLPEKQDDTALIPMVSRHLINIALGSLTAYPVAAFGTYVLSIIRN